MKSQKEKLMALKGGTKSAPQSKATSVASVIEEFNPDASKLIKAFKLIDLPIDARVISEGIKIGRFNILKAKEGNYYVEGNPGNFVRLYDVFLRALNLEMAAMLSEKLKEI